MPHWRQDEYEALLTVVEKYQSLKDFEYFIEYCQLKQKGLRKSALQKMALFISYCQTQNIDKQRAIVKELSDVYLTNKSSDFVFVAPLKIYMIDVLKLWLIDEPNNADFYYLLGKLTYDKTYFFKGLEIDDKHLDCALEVILTKLDFVNYQLHHIGESRFVYDAGNEEDGKKALQEVDELLKKYPEIKPSLKQEYQQTKQLFDDWLAFSQSGFDDFTVWCKAHQRSYQFISAIYYE